MTYDGFTLAAVVAELNHRIIGGKVQKIRQHNDTDITLEIRAPGHTYLLFFSVDARFPRVYLATSEDSVPQEPPNFCMLMRKYAQGAYVVEFEQVGMDRIMKAHLQYPDGTRVTLIFEVMGKHSNLILTDSEDKILGAIKHVGSSISRVRQILPGREYAPPPGAPKVDPRTLTNEIFDQLWESPLRERTDRAAVRQWLMNTFSGFGPFLADEIITRSSVDDVVSPERIRDEMLELGAMVANGSFVPVLITDERGR
ncbi:NFACT family protein, partial [bacterium]|nr:NFACT family protein [bacterium]